MPQKLAEIYTSRLRRQRDVEAEFLSEIETLREKYRTLLFNMSKDFKSKGLNSQLRDIELEIDETSKGGQKFVDYMLGGG